MAQMSPDDFIEALESFTESLKNSGSASQQHAEGMMKAAGIDIKAAEAQMAAWKKLGSSTAEMAKGMYKGANSAQSMAASLDVVSTGLDVVLTTFFPQAKLLVKALSFIAKATFGAAKVIADQAQAEFKAYQDLNRVGAAGTQGLQGVFDTVQKFGYNVNELDKMVALVAENSQSLAQFGGTASRGTAEFANAMNQLTHGPAAVELETLGKLPEDINKAGASFIRQQVMLGRTQLDVGNNLTGQTKQYVLELDRLQRLTGLSADAIQKKQEEALYDSAYASYLDQLMESGEAGQKQADYIKAVLLTLPDEYAKMARRGIGGDVAAYDQLNFIMPSLMANLRDGSATLVNTVETNERELRRFKNEFGPSYQVAADAMEQFGGKFITTTQAISMAANFRKRVEEVGRDVAEAELQQDIKNMATSAVNERERTANLQNMVQNGVKPATDALAGLAEAANRLTSFLPGSKGATTGAGATTGVQIVGSAEARAKAEAYYGKKMSDAEFSALIKATHAEASAGKGSQQEQAMIMASILNRARTDAGGIKGALEVKGAFQAVTGTFDKAAKSWTGPSKNYLQGPDKDRLKLIEGSTELLDKISREQKNFTAADPRAYGPGTNIGYRNNMLAAGGQVIGGTVFQTGMPSGPTDKYETPTSNIKPTTTLPEGNEQSKTAARDTESENILAGFTSSLREVMEPMERRLSGIEDNTKKSAQAQNR